MYNTNTFKVGNTHYCSYCRKEAKEEKDYEYHDITYYHSCDCECAKKEIEIQNKQLGLKIELNELQRKCIFGDDLEEFKLTKQLEFIRKRKNKI